MSGVLALAIKRAALSHGTVPSAVPVGRSPEGGTGGTTGTLGTAGTIGTGRTTTAARIDGEPIDVAEIEELAGLAAHRVPRTYLAAWTRLNHHKPAQASESEWMSALNDGGRFLDAWGDLAAGLGWTAEDLLSPASGLLWRLVGTTVESLGADHARLSDGRAIRRFGGAMSYSKATVPARTQSGDGRRLSDVRVGRAGNVRIQW